MNKSILMTLSLAAFLQACSQNHTSAPAAATAAGEYRNKIVLGEFVDMVAETSFDENALAGLPKIVDLKEEMTITKNQGDRGTCTFFSTLGLVEGTIKQDMKIDVNLSEQYLNYQTKSFGFFSSVEGSTVNSNFYALNLTGLLLERDSVYEPSWFQKGMKCAAYKSTDHSAPRECFSHTKPDETTLLKVIPADGLKFGNMYKDTTAIIKFLAEQKRPLTMSVTVNFNGWPATGDVFHNDELRDECLAEPTACGGHSVLLTGYDLEKKLFFFKNSWGKDWGRDGYGTISFETVDKYVTGDMTYAWIEKPLDIPADYAEIKEAKLIKFESRPFIGLDKTIKVNVTAELEETSGQVVYLSSFLSKKLKSDAEAASEHNTTSVMLNAEETKLVGENYSRAVKYVYTDAGADFLEWTEKAPLILQVSPESVKTYSVQNVLSSKVYDTYLRTTIYVHNDIDSYKILKRVFQKIK